MDSLLFWCPISILESTVIVLLKLGSCSLIIVLIYEFSKSSSDPCTNKIIVFEILTHFSTMASIFSFVLWSNFLSTSWIIPGRSRQLKAALFLVYMLTTTSLLVSIIFFDVPSLPSLLSSSSLCFVSSWIASSQICSTLSLTSCSFFVSKDSPTL
ncbi:unnamed protein product [Moneuplotes crassus]|uniref:Uncharacterized protein n=1 Tax=Euplotes crassus TaxID=5936 RepID=A0AAD2DCQ1_EUPCR|nr:unnamed protein product [Moneuplotes crassus]